MSTLGAFFENTSNVLESKYKRTATIDNASLKGSDRELFIKEFLEKSFPKKFVIGTGEILDSSDHRSKQADIVIYDEFMPVFDYGSTKHFLSGGVLAHIEVKSYLSSEELKRALDITKSIKKLNRDLEYSAMHFGSLPKTIFSCIFAYDGLTQENLKKSFEDYYKDDENVENMVDAICVLNKYTMLKIFLPKKDSQERETKIGFLETGADSLMMFFARLFQAMYKNWSGIPDIFKYLGDIKDYKFF